MKAIITTAAIILTTTFATAQKLARISDEDLLSQSVWKEVRYEGSIKGKEILVTDCNVDPEPKKNKISGKFYVVVGRYYTKGGMQLGWDNKYHHQPTRDIELRVEFDKAADAIWFCDTFSDEALGWNALAANLGNAPVVMNGRPGKFRGAHNQELGTKGYVVLVGGYVSSFKKGPSYKEPEEGEGEGGEGRID